MTQAESIAAPAVEVVPRKIPRSWRAFGLRCFQGALLASLAFASYLLISHFVVQSVRVVGSSMVPTLQDSECYLLNRWIYRVRNPGRSEIVVLKDPGDGGFSVKRVIAVAGDTLTVKRARVYLNGRLLDESYLPTGTTTYGGPKQADFSVRLRPGQFFVMGDNRGNSVDSRSYGPVPADHILGLVVR